MVPRDEHRSGVINPVIDGPADLTGTLHQRNVAALVRIVPQGGAMRLTASRFLVALMVFACTVSVPTVLAQETSVPADEEVSTQPILAVQFPHTPPAPAHIAVVRYTLPPGTSVPSGETTGPRLFIAESGEITVASTESDSGFRRAADAPPNQSSQASITDAILQPGDHYLPTDPAPLDLRNDGSRAAAFLDAFIFPTAPLGVVPHTTMDGVVVDPLVVGIADAVPTAPFELRIERLDLANGAQITLVASSGPRLFVVESGTLGLSAETGVITYSGAAGNNPGSTAGRVRTVSPGSESLLTARGSVVVQAGASGAARNLGRTRLVLLSVTLLPAGAVSASVDGTPNRDPEFGHRA
jgi:hypothetical protein